VLHVALEVPLAALAFARRGQRGDAAHARVQALGDALDHAALARGVAPFEQHHHLELLGDHPVLQLDEFALQAQQFAKVGAAVFVELRGGGVGGLADQAVHAFVVDLHLELFVDAVDHVSVQAPFVFLLGGGFVHGGPRVAVRAFPLNRFSAARLAAQPIGVR
jgi:hypothetical protein